MKFRGIATRQPDIKDYETPQGKTMTIQDDSFSIIEIINRHAQGLPVHRLEGVYLDEQTHDDLDLEEFDRMDFNDKFNIHQEHLERVKEAKEELNRRNKKEPKKEGEGGS